MSDLAKTFLLAALGIACSPGWGHAGAHRALDARGQSFIAAPAADGAVTRVQSVNVTVNTASFAFVPQVIAVPAGTQVVWQDPSFNGINDICHTVTTAASLQDALANKRNLDPNNPDSFDENLCNSQGLNVVTHTFTKPGIYYYYCKPHVQFGMLGAVIVGP